MDAPSSAACGIACLAVASFLLLSGHLRRRKLKLPPGPKPWPIIGNLNLISPLLHRSLHELSHIYGPIMKLQLGSCNVVVCSSADMAKAILKTHDAVFAYRPRNAAGKYTAYNYSGMTWSPYGPYFQQGYIKRMKAVNKKFDRFLEHVLGEHEARRVEGYEAKDKVDVLLQHVDDPNLRVKIERHGVKALTQELIAGGTEGSAASVEWAMCELLKNPYTFNKATQELDNIIGRERWVQEADVTNLPYLNAVIKEMMRLHPVGAFLAHRFASQDCKVAGYDVPKGTRVLVSKWSIGRDPELWDDPENFRPERFIGKAIDVKGQDFELLPFGSGRRMCPGYNLGLRMIQTSLANLIHGFSWKLPKNMTREELNIEEVPGLSTPKKIPLVAVAEPRLPLHLY